MSDGETIEEAMADGEDAKCCWIAAMKEAGRPIPPPSIEPAESDSGKWQLRAPKSLHRRLAERAKREGVSLNTLAVTLLGEGLGERSAHGDEPSADGPPIGVLAETIGPDDLPSLNRTLGALFALLREARGLQEGNNNGRAAAVVALRATAFFLMSFRGALTEGLHMPLLNLAGALLALNNNSVEPVLRPTKRTGRAVSSPQRFALIGIAVGAARRLEWTAMLPAEADKAVAARLARCGVKPARGGGAITARTLRGWREGVDVARPLLGVLRDAPNPETSAEDVGWISAVVNADAMVTEEWRSCIRALALADGRRFILHALEENIREMKLG